MKIKRTPKPWASQKVFFDVVVFNNGGFEIERRAMFLCKTCRHICKWDEDSDAFRCVRCGKKLSKFGAHEILKRYEEQLNELKKAVTLPRFNKFQEISYENRDRPN